LILTEPPLAFFDLMERDKLINYLNELMRPETFEDYMPNGLQVEGAGEIKRILFSPSVSRNVIQEAIKNKCDTVFVHHGFFFKGLPVVFTGVYREKIKLLIENNMNLIAYHLPLDFLPLYGNNEPVAQQLGLQNIHPFENIGYKGEFPEALSVAKYHEILFQIYKTKGIQIFSDADKKIKSVAVVSGGAQDYFQKAINAQCDAFITGESSEWVYHMALESGVHFSAMGHYKSETIGVDLLSRHLQMKFELETILYLEENPF